VDKGILGVLAKKTKKMNNHCGRVFRHDNGRDWRQTFEQAKHSTTLRKHGFT
jgi:hypothetical protein